MPRLSQELVSSVHEDYLWCVISYLSSRSLASRSDRFDEGVATAQHMFVCEALGREADKVNIP
jgi:hypothetical protein